MKRLMILCLFAATSFASSPLERTWQFNSEQYMTFAAGRVNGFAGCNTFSGAYTQVDSSLTFSAFATTRMGCEKSIMTSENQFLQRLSRTKRFFISQDAKRLSLIGDGILRLQPR